MTITPNVIGFQTVMHGIAARLRSPDSTATITVDHQQQFNNAQAWLADFYAKARTVTLVSGPGLPNMDLSKMPLSSIGFQSSKASAGLELVDVYLWLFKRFLEEKEIPPALQPLIRAQLGRGRTDEISLKGIERRWTAYFKNLPDPTDEQLQKAAQVLQTDEARRRQAVADGKAP